MSEERELKYSVRDVPMLEAWLDVHLPPKPGLPPWRDAEHDDLYFDTADRALERAGYGARLRRTDGATVVGLKASGTADGALHTRREIEGPATDSLSPPDWPPSPARDLVRRVTAGRPLRPRFRLEQRRREREALSGNAELLVSIDEVLVIADDGPTSRLLVFEVELRDGAPAALGVIAAQLATSGAVEPETRSKLEIAAALTSR